MRHAIEIDTRKNLIKDIISNRYTYLLIAPAVISLLVFSYAPMYGIMLAFKKYIIVRGILGSPWIGFDNYEFMLRDINFWYSVRNTLIISFGKLVLGFPAPLILALLLNELKSERYKKTVQSLVYLPHFLSWVIVAGIMYNFLSVSSGLVNKVIMDVFNADPIQFLGNPQYFLPLVFISDIWKGAGWGTIIYIAAISGINPEVYEAAIIDGANKLKRVFYVTLPSIKGTIVILLILSVGGIMNAGFDQVFNLYSPGVYEVGDIIDTYVYRMGIGKGKFEYSTAIGLFTSVINCAMLLTANRVVKLFGEEGLFS